MMIPVSPPTLAVAYPFCIDAKLYPVHTDVTSAHQFRTMDSLCIPPLRCFLVNSFRVHVQIIPCIFLLPRRLLCRGQLKHSLLVTYYCRTTRETLNVYVLASNGPKSPTLLWDSNMEIEDYRQCCRWASHSAVGTIPRMRSGTSSAGTFAILFTGARLASARRFRRRRFISGSSSSLVSSSSLG